MTDPSQYFKGRTVQEQMNEVIGYVDTRSAEVATAAIANDVAQVHQDKLDADGYAQAAAASASAAAGTLANAVKKTGEASQSIAGDIAVAGDLSGGTVTVPAPVNNTDAASKKYVDDADALKMDITDINSYAVGLTGNQGPIGGMKTFGRNVVHSESGNQYGFVDQRTDIDITQLTDIAYKNVLKVVDSENNNLAALEVRGRTDGTTIVYIKARNSDGSMKTVTLVAGDVI